MYKVEISIGSVTEQEGWSDITKRRESYKEYSRGLYTSFMVDDSITLEELFKQAEHNAKEVCLARDEKFVDITIHSLIKKEI